MAGLVDVPELSRGNDSLNVSTYAEVLTDFIIGCSTPLTIGLQGDWGTGKTTLINFIQEDLDKQKKVDYVLINTWQYSQFQDENLLPISVMKGITNKLLSLSPTSTQTDKAINLSKNMATLGFNAMKVAAKAIADVDIEAGLQSVQNNAESDTATIVEKLKSDFQGVVQDIIVQRKLNKIVIFIDDLDRILPMRAVEVLEVLKNFLDVEGCVFVLACDYQVVQKGVAQKFGYEAQEISGRSFFDKIIQVPFQMPVAAFNIKSFLEACYYSSGLKAGLTKNYFERITEVMQTQTSFNPRMTKRLVNITILVSQTYAKTVNGTNHKKRLNENEMVTLYWVVCFQHFYPDMFRYFAMNVDVELINSIVSKEWLTHCEEYQVSLQKSFVQDVASYTKSFIAFMEFVHWWLDEDADKRVDDGELQYLIEIMNHSKMCAID